MTNIPFDIVGFDLDGTLLDTGTDLAVAVNHALGTIGQGPLPIDEIKPFIGKGARRMLERSLAVAGIVDEALTDALLTVLLDYYGEHIAVHSRSVPEALRKLYDAADLAKELTGR